MAKKKVAQKSIRKKRPGKKSGTAKGTRIRGQTRKSAGSRVLSEPTGKSLLPGMVAAAHASGAILRKYYEKLTSPRPRNLKIAEKAGAGLVTNADLESERKCVAMLKKLRPDFGFLTEEATIASTAHLPGRFILDPLDGTTNFVHGFPMFCVSLAAEWKGEVIAAVIYHPILDETYTAVRGGGARLNGKPISVSETSTLDDSLVTTGFAYKKNQLLPLEMKVFEEVSRVARAVRRPGSAALDLAYTARGVFDGFWERNLSPWDTAAGFLIVQEAGGIVTDFGGHPYQVSSPAILAANPRLHPTLVNAVGMDLIED